MNAVTYDDLGHPVAMARRPERVISLVPSLTEAIAASAPDLLAGATDWCTHPADPVSYTHLDVYKRQRLSRDIHDTVAQGFSSIVLLARGASVSSGEGELRRLLARIEDTAADNLTEIRACLLYTSRCV